MPNLIAISLRGASPKYVKYYAFVTFLLSCPVLVILFFSQLRPGRTPGRNLTIYGLNDASSPKDVPFGGLSDHRTSTPVPNFIAISLRGASPKYVKYYAFVTFLLSCPVLVILFFLGTPPRSNPWTEFNH